MSEESKARAYRAQMQAREDNRLALERSLAGSREALVALERAWSPLRRWDGWSPTIRVSEDVS